jgi:hypothetical protein
MADTVEDGTRRTNLEVPPDLVTDIDELARADLRKFKPEIIALLREAVAARKRRAS